MTKHLGCNSFLPGATRILKSEILSGLLNLGRGKKNELYPGICAPDIRSSAYISFLKCTNFTLVLVPRIQIFRCIDPAQNYK